MAYIVPSDLSRLSLAGDRSPELVTLALLKSSLPGDYTVYHGVHWSREYRGYTVYGEVDFVVLNRSGDTLLIEQKNGKLEETADGLVKIYETGPKNVNEQIRRSLENVREKYKWTHSREDGLRLDYLIYCPDYKVIRLNAAALDRSRIIDASQRDQLPERIQEILGPGDPAVVDHRYRVERFFDQSFEVVPDIHAHLSAQEKAFTRLSGGLVKIIGNLEMSPMRLRVDGVAGSGKSVVARHAHDAFLRAGKRSLLVCFNRPLAEKLGHAVEPGGYVNTWYGLCSKFLEGQGQTIDFDKMRSDPDFWLRIQERVVDQTVPDDWKFDALVVDEGQDFEALWFDVLGTFLRENADILWLQDVAQNIRRATGVDLPEFVGYRCFTNFRTPETIARFILRHSPYQFECANDLPGLGVGVSRFEDPEDQPRIVAGIVQELMRRGFGIDDIAVLSCRGVTSSVFSQRERVGNQTLKQFTGEYDMFGNQMMSKGRLLFDSVYRFKGHQAPAVILVDVDPEADDEARGWRLLHTGMTRAMVRLELVVKAGNSITDEMGTA